MLSTGLDGRRGRTLVTVVGVAAILAIHGALAAPAFGETPRFGPNDAELIGPAVVVNAHPHSSHDPADRPVQPNASTLQPMEAEFVSLINRLRASKGLAAMQVHSELVAKARSWSATMAARGDIWHSTLSDGLNVNDWYRLGENVGMGGSVPALHDAFVASPGHYKNLVDPGFEYIGVGIVVATDGTIFVTQSFMEMQAPEPAPEPEVTNEPTPMPEPEPSPAPKPPASSEPEPSDPAPAERPDVRRSMQQVPPDDGLLPRPDADPESRRSPAEAPASEPPRAQRDASQMSDVAAYGGIAALLVAGGSAVTAWRLRRKRVTA